MTPSALAAPDAALYGVWHDNLREWILTRGVHIALVIGFVLLTTRVIRWVAKRIGKRIAETDEREAVVRSENVKHRQAVASVISSVSIAVLYATAATDVADQLGLPIGSMVAPAAVLGAALGFGAQRIVQDLLSGFFLITERQYGFGDLVELTVNGGGTARGTVEDVTLRTTTLRNGDGEVYTIPNGQIVKALNLSKDWARAVVDIPVPTSADINHVNDVLRDVAKAATQDDGLPDLLLDEPQLMGVESIDLDTVNLRMVARTLPGKQFDVGRRLRALVVSALGREGISTEDGKSPAVTGVASNAGSAGGKPGASG
jgi:small conductance mechanosensitive channel